jgi:AbrB family looped-hinge helix DNA binding protein
MDVEIGEGAQTFHTKVDRSGRIQLPAELRSRNRIEIGDAMVVVQQDDNIVIKTLEQSVREAQEYFLSVIPVDVSLVDELIAERRDEAASE